MSMTYSSSTLTGEAATYGGFVDAVGGIATIVLAIIGLAGIHPLVLASIATVVFAAALLIQGGAMLSEFAEIEITPETSVAPSGGGLSALFLVGIAGIVLGVLALLGVRADILTPVAVIAFGGALLISCSAVWQLLTQRSIAARFQSRSPMLRIVAGEVAVASAAVQGLAGIAIIVLGILSVAHIYADTLALVGLLVAGSAVLLTGSTLSATMIGFMPAVGAAGPAQARGTA